MTKQINFVMISPNFPPNYETFAVRLREKGINVLGVGDEAYDNLSQTLKDNLTEYYYVNNMEDYGQQYEAIRFFQEKYGSVDRLESHNEHWLASDASLRSDFNIFGLKNEDMERIKSKSGMKEIFRQSGVKVAAGRVFTDDEDARNLANELGYPVIAKPDIGVGAADTWKIENPDQLEEFLSQRNHHIAYIMEEFISGDIITFDGITNKDCQVVFYSSQVHASPILDVAEGDTLLTFYTARDFPEDLVEQGTRAVENFRLPERFFHMEFFKTDQGELVALEINCRPPGGIAIDMMNYANSIDVFAEYANIVAGYGFQAELTRPYNAFYVARSFNKNYTHSYDDVMARYWDRVAYVYESPRVLADVMGDYAFIILTENADEVSQIYRYVTQIQE